MDPGYLIIAALTAGGGLAAFCLRNLVHSALATVMAFAGLAILYLRLGAEFVGFAQILVYIGAVAILIVFAILLTRGGVPTSKTLLAPRWWAGVAAALLVFAGLGWSLLNSRALEQATVAKPEITVDQIGKALMTQYILPLEVIGLLLTAALIGAVLIAMKDKEPQS